MPTARSGGLPGTRVPWLLACLFFAGTLFAAPPVTDAARPAVMRSIPASEQSVDRIFVRFRDGSLAHAQAGERARVVAAAGREKGVRFSELRRTGVGADVFRLDRRLPHAAVQALVRALLRDPQVQYAGPDILVQPTMTPDDISFMQQWAYNEPNGIHVQRAWDRSTGAGMVVAVIDTGITAHPDIQANLVAGYDFMSDAAMARDGNGRDADPSDMGDWVAANECIAGSPAANSSWHGTHVAGSIAAVANNSADVAGTAPAAKVQPVRALGKCGGFVIDLADAIFWAAGGSLAGVPANATPADVINLSLGYAGPCDGITQAAIDYANAVGTVVVVAAGNDNVDAGTFSPARCNNVITVGALSRYGGKASYSNHGAVLDVWAPGGGATNGYDYIVSLGNSGTQGPVAPLLTWKIGTSMAAPHVAGVVALMQSVHPQTPAAVEALLKSSGRVLPGTICGTSCHAPLVDAYAAVSRTRGPGVYVSDVQGIEGETGTVSVTITVSLQATQGTAVTFDLATANGTAIASVDYNPRNLTNLTIPAGTLSKTTTVAIRGDALEEGDESFFVNLANVRNAVVADAQAEVTILDNEARPLPNRIPVTGLASGTGRPVLYYLDSPADRDFVLSFTRIGWGSAQGTSSFYVRKNVPPTPTTYDYFMNPSGSAVNIVENPAAIRWYVLVDGDFSHTALKAEYWPMLNVGNHTVEEGDSGTRNVVFTVSPGIPQPFAMVYSLGTDYYGGSTASDFTAWEATNQVIPGGQAGITHTVVVNGDTTVEPNEGVGLNFRGSTNTNARYGGITILNDDGPTLSIGDASEDEGASGIKMFSFPVTLSEPAPGPVTFYVSTTNGTATANSDYAPTNPSQLTIPAGMLSTIHGVNVYGDALVEANETFVVNLSGSSGASVLDNLANATIVNDDGPRLSIGNDTRAEANGPATFLVSLSEVSAQPVTVQFATASGTAAAGSDFTAVTRTLTFDPGETSENVLVTIVNDAIAEPNETYTATLANATGATILAGTGNGSILDDDGPRLSIGDYAKAEGNSGSSSMVFTVTLSGTATTPVTFDVSLQGDSATADVDFVDAQFTGLTIATGQSSKTFAVQVLGDTSVETDEIFHVTVHNPSGATVLDGVATGRILNDDGVVLSVADAAVTEGTGCYTTTLEFTVSLSQASAGPVAFFLSATQGESIPGEDYIDSQVSYHEITPGHTGRTATIDVLCDDEQEPNETFEVYVHDASGVDSVLDSTATGTIRNDDGATLSIGDASVTEGNAGTKSLVFPVLLSQPSTEPVTVNLATDSGTAGTGNDFVGRTLNGLTIAAGATSASFAVTINGETWAEANETFYADIEGASGATILDARGIGTILNDDGPTLSIGDVTVVEGSTGSKLAAFVVSLSQAATGPVTFSFAAANGTASAGSDFLGVTFHGQSIAAGMLSKTLHVPVYGDTAIEDNETYVVNLSAATGATIADAQAIGTIRNDDGPTLSIDDASVSEGNSGTKVLNYTVRLSQAAPDPVTYSIATDGSTGATAGTDYTTRSLAGETIPAGQLTRTFAVTIKGDTAAEANEKLYVDLTAASGASIADSRATGTILNDDGPTLSINNIATAEGHSGTRLASFIVSLSQAASVPVTYSISTQDGSAKASSDYVAASLTGQTIPIGLTSKVFSVTLNGDTAVEANEKLYANLTASSGASILVPQGYATVLNDDGPTLSIANVTVAEGQSGTQVVTLTVLLSQTAAVPVTYNIATSDSTALAGSDYVAKSLAGETIPAGSLSRTFQVTVNGDTAIEATEKFKVTVSAITGATGFDPSADVTLSNDD